MSPKKKTYSTTRLEIINYIVADKNKSAEVNRRLRADNYGITIMSSCSVDLVATASMVLRLAVAALSRATKVSEK